MVNYQVLKGTMFTLPVARFSKEVVFLIFFCIISVPLTSANATIPMNRSKSFLHTSESGRLNIMYNHLLFTAGTREVMVIGGWKGADSTSVAHVVPLGDGREEPNISCRVLPSLPEALHAMVAAAPFPGPGQVTACGGRSTAFRDTHREACYTYTATDNEWTMAPFSLSKKLAFAGSGLYNSTMMVLGGIDGDTGMPISSTERMDSAGNTFTPGLPLPHATSRFCIVKLNSTHLFVAGGTSGGDTPGGGHYLRKAHLLDIEEQKWTRLPDLDTERMDPACGVAGGSDIVVAGGVSDGGPTKTVEILDLEDVGDGWRPGPELPVPTDSAVSIQLPSQVCSPNKSQILASALGGIECR